ncbi:MAG: hypothetical protein AVDCRST_MAG40-1797, partial [uncultured Gemmatimonadaceae bacterium]
VEPRHRVPAHVPALAAHPLVAPRAEGQVARAGEQHHAGGEVVARVVEGVDQLRHRLGAEGVAHLRPVDRDPGDPLAGDPLVQDVRV